MPVRKWIFFLGIIFAVGSHVSPIWAQAVLEERPAVTPTNQRPPFPDLVGGLKKTPGCLGVETARTGSGKNVIFAWFRDKEAAIEWFDSDMHQEVMNKFFPDRAPREPLANVPDDSGPILAIASITFQAKPALPGTSVPASQIAIELYGPVAGGLAQGGRFAPDSVKVPHLVDYSQSSGGGK